MFTALSERLTATLKRLTGRGVLSEQDVTEALREIRRHLLEADVSFEVTTGFVERVRERAVGVIAVKSVSPGQQVAKLVHDELARMLGASDEDLARKVGARPAAPLQFAPVGRRRSNNCVSLVSRLASRCSRGSRERGAVPSSKWSSRRFARRRKLAAARSSSTRPAGCRSTRT